MFYRQPLSVNLDSYLLGTANVLRIIGRYGTPMVGKSRSAAAAASVLLGAVAYCLASELGLVSIMVKRRYRSLDNTMKEEAAALLKDVMSTSVAGL